MNAPGWWGAPLAPLYALATTSRRIAYDRGWLSSYAAGLPTLSVGGLEVGGVGKTPITEWLLRGLLARGHAPGLLSRGYGRTERELVVRQAGSGRADPLRIGDEPAMLADAVDVPMAIDGDRLAGARALGKTVDCLVLDDGFAHRRLKRELDIVVLRPTPTPDRLRPLPWGPLRESVAGLKRAHVLWFHARGQESFDEIESFVERYAPGALVVTSHARVSGCEALVGQPVVLVTGVARPDQVRSSLERQGVNVVDTLVFPDHHRFDRVDEAQVQKHAGGVTVVVTAKDAVKMRDWRLPYRVVGVSVEPLSGVERFWADAVARVFPQQLSSPRDK